MIQVLRSGLPAHSDSAARRHRGVSRWAVVILAAAGLGISAYLTLFQLRTIQTVWDPLFSGSAWLLRRSPLVKRLGFPDSALGGVAYLIELCLGLLAAARPRTQRLWRVLALGLVVGGMTAGSAGLVGLQAFYGRWCTLCLTSAAVTFAIAAVSAGEVRAALRTVLDRRKALRAGTAADPSASPGPGPEAALAEPLQQGTELSAGGVRSVRAAPERSNGMRKIAVVTGASAGVGRATAVAFAKKGYDIALLARGAEGLQACAKEVEAAGGRALVVPTDVADNAQVEAAAGQVERELGEIDVWVNDAFTAVFAPFWEVSAEEFHRVTEVAYLGFVYGTMAALKRMRPRNRGTIVQVGSALAYRGIPLQTAYCGAKHAIQGFTESLRCELLHDKSNVSITMVQLPAVNTPQFSWVLSRLPRHPQPVPPIYQPEVPAAGIVYAAEHPRRREYWVGVPTAATIMANAVIPGLLDHYLGATGFKSQQTREPADPHRPVNLYEPADATSDFGAHGVFDDRSHSRSAQWWATSHRRLVYGATALMAVTAATMVTRNHQ